MASREPNHALAQMLDQDETQGLVAAPAANGHAENGHAKPAGLEQAVYGAFWETLSIHGKYEAARTRPRALRRRLQPTGTQKLAVRSRQGQSRRCTVHFGARYSRYKQPVGYFSHGLV